ncbi:nucleotidyltransferase domain-containing protein [uncultured Flavobacterium sp.]|uniref:nucleotidyltransferase family protein n=1 Tax=uncultured Flavobacterium sp. TaxID=165435 RepID=UPI0025E73F8B|nr:nucleotidyltransferase domain-containing protein [uncultured Flavobacterium sp.]
MELSKSKIDTIKDYFKAKPVLKAYLFGSYVRGEADEESDIDLVIDLDYKQKIGLQFIQMKLDLEDLLKVKVDLVSSGGLSKHLQATVDNEKQLIYAKILSNGGKSLGFAIFLSTNILVLTSTLYGM